MAGGDYALIKSVEGFEDFAPFGRRQIADLGVREGRRGLRHHRGRRDLVRHRHRLGGPGGGRARWPSSTTTPTTCCGPTSTRSREVLDEPRIHKVNLTTGPMAITGSTRMQATSIELLAMLTVLEMTLARRPGPRGGGRAGPRPVLVRARGDAGGPPRAPRRARERATSAGDLGAARDRRGGGVPPGRADLLLRRRAGGGRAHRHHGAQPDLLHALVPEVGRRGGLRVVGVPVHAGRHRPRRPGRGSSAARRRPSSGRRTTCGRCSTRRRQRGRGRSCGRSAGRELMRFRIGLDGLAHRPARPGDGVTAVVAESGPPAPRRRATLLRRGARRERGRPGRRRR